MYLNLKNKYTFVYKYMSHNVHKYGINKKYYELWIEAKTTHTEVHQNWCIKYHTMY